MKPPVVVAVVSWNTRELLGRCLGSLAADADAGRAEVWVFDNASSDGSPDLVASEFPWVELVRSPDNIGFGRAVNEVALRTESEWIAPANADIELEETTLTTLLEAGAAYPEAGILAPRLATLGGETQHSVHAFPGVRLAAIVATGLTSVSPSLGDRLCIEGSWDPERPREVDWAHGAFLLCRRRTFEQLNGFDPRQWMYAEDLDLAWRATRAGAPVRYIPAARVRHAGAAATTQAFGDERGARFMMATFAWMADRRGLAVTWLYAGINLIGALARWLGYSAMAVVRPSRFGRRRDAARRWLGLHRKGLASRSALLGSRDG
jgi:GT2 family glycosyltransferase